MRQPGAKKELKLITFLPTFFLCLLFFFFFGFDSGYSAITLVTYVYQNVKKKKKKKNLFKNIFRKKKKKEKSTGCVSVDCVKIYFHYINETHLGTCVVSASFPQLGVKHD